MNKSIITITWNTPDIGWLTRTYEGTTFVTGQRIVSRRMAIAEAIIKYVVCLNELLETTKSVYTYISFAEPKFSWISRKLTTDIEDYAKLWLENGVKKWITMPEKDLLHYQFIAVLNSKKRDWQGTCAICLCDNTEAKTIFRPCGHSICTAPCFNNLIKSVEAPTKRISDYNLDTNGQFMCPICRTHVRHTFSSLFLAYSDWDSEEAIKAAEHILYNSYIENILGVP